MNGQHQKRISENTSIFELRKGGARNIHFNSNSTTSDIITKMTELFYPNDKSRFGRQTESSFRLGNFRGQIIEQSSSEPFALSNYINVIMMSKTRLSSCKENSRLGIITDRAQSSLDCRFDSIQKVNFSFSLFISLALSHVRCINGSWRKVDSGSFNEKYYEFSCYRQQRGIKFWEIKKAGPNQNKKCIWLLDHGPFYEIIFFILFLFLCKTFEKGINRRMVKYQVSFFVKKCAFLLI